MGRRGWRTAVAAGLLVVAAGCSGGGRGEGAAAPASSAPAVAVPSDTPSADVVAPPAQPAPTAAAGEAAPPPVAPGPDDPAPAELSVCDLLSAGQLEILGLPGGLPLAGDPSGEDPLDRADGCQFSEPTAQVPEAVIGHAVGTTVDAVITSLAQGGTAQTTQTTVGGARAVQVPSPVGSGCATLVEVAPDQVLFFLVPGGGADSSCPRSAEIAEEGVATFQGA